MTKLAAALAAFGAVVFAFAAFASPPLVNDASYVAAARCYGLATSPDLGPADVTGPIGRFMAVQAAGRTANVTDQANEARDNAKREAATAGPDGRDRLAEERESYPCRMYANIGAHS